MTVENFFFRALSSVAASALSASRQGDRREQDSTFERQFGLLKMELELINSAIRQHDDITKSIKDWAIVTWTAAMGFSLSKDELKPFSWLVAVLPLLFWLMDSSFRRIQRSFINRVDEIALYLNSPEFNLCAKHSRPMNFTLMAMRSLSDSWRDSLLGVMLFRTVGILYAGLFLASIVGAMLANS